MYHFSLHIGDYVTATAHLTMLEDGAYNRLLRRYYQDEKPIPADLAEACRLVGARSKEERQAVKTVLAEFFFLEGDVWRQKRADEEIATYHSKAGTARKNGQGGGRPPKTDGPPDKKPKRKPTGNQSGFSSVPESGVLETDDKPTAKPNRKPITEDVAKTESVADSASGNPAGTQPVVEGHEGWEPEGAGAGQEPRPFIPSPGRAHLLPSGWKPSEQSLEELSRARPDLGPEMIELRTTAYRKWCAETKKFSHDHDASWFNFMVKTHDGRGGLPATASAVRPTSEKPNYHQSFAEGAMSAVDNPGKGILDP